MSGVIINPFAFGAAAAFAVDLPATTQNAIRAKINGTAGAGWRFNPDGTVDRDMNGWTSGVHNWGTPTGGTPGSDYQIKATLNSGTSPDGDAVGSWLALSSARTWTHTRNADGIDECTLTIEIRDTATSTVQDTGTYYIKAQYIAL